MIHCKIGGTFGDFSGEGLTDGVESAVYAVTVHPAIVIDIKSWKA